LLKIKAEAEATTTRDVIEICFNFWQPEKWESPVSVVSFGKLSEVREVQPLKAEAPISRTAGMETVVSPVLPDSALGGSDVAAVSESDWRFVGLLKRERSREATPTSIWTKLLLEKVVAWSVVSFGALNTLTTGELSNTYAGRLVTEASSTTSRSGQP
jgi:hypothetical protein